MATSTNMSPSEEKAFYMRIHVLLVEGGTLVLRNLLDSKHPASQWNAFINQAHIRTQVTQLRNRKVLTDVQYNLLYPQFGVTDPSKYDVSLIVCLLRSFCGLNSKAAVWNGFPPSSDQSEEADIRRLNIERNKMAHGTSASITKQEFETHWTYIEQVLLRLDRNIPDLKQNIDILKTKSIDPAREHYLLDVIKAWEEMDEHLQADISEMKSKVEGHDQSIQTLTRESADLQTQTGQLQTTTKELSGRICEREDDSKRQDDRIKLQDQELQSLALKFENSASGQTDLETKLTDTNETVAEHERRLTDVEGSARDTNEEMGRLRDNQATLEQATKMSCELKNLRDHTQWFLSDSLSDDVYVRTRLHEEAYDKLETNNIVVLSGHPGEGKTSMAMKLILEVTTKDRCLKLTEPSDWRHIDFEVFDTFFIDDIFGPGVLDESLVKGWDKRLPEMWKAIQKKSIKVVITTRHYILEEAKQIFNRSAVFQEKHVQLLSSKDLSTNERRQMLISHLNDNDRLMRYDDVLIESCVALSTSFLDLLLGQEPSFLFGFPECVSMFVQNEELLNRGPEFFSNPNHFFRNCLEELKKEEEKFLALLIMWTRQDKTLFRHDLDLSSMSEEISKVSKMFGYKLKGKLLKILRNSLKHHTNGFIRYSPAAGAYRFSHNVISDMIGLVISEDYPEACLEFTDRDFLLEYITIKSNEEGRFRFFVEEHLHDKLMQAIIRLSEKPPETFSRVLDLLLLKRSGRRPNRVQSMSKFDDGVFFHDVFYDQKFVRKFVTHLTECHDVGKILNKPVMKMSGFFISYGFELKEMNIYLPAYSLFHSEGLLLLELLAQKVIPREFDENHENELYLALLIAAHENQIDVAKALVNSNVEVPEEAIYVAAMQQHLELLQFLLENSEKHATSRCTFENNNNAVIVASKKGLTESVRRLAKFKDLSLRNDAKVSALDKAVIYKWHEITEILIDNGAPINEKGGRFKRTPLHTASDMGQSIIVEQLLKAGADTRIKDHRGHFAIHCATIQNHVDIVKILASHDPTQVTLRIGSYGKASKIRGMTVFHIAYWKTNLEMLKALLDVSQDCNVQDWFGRTPFYQASYDGNEEIVNILLPHADVNKPEKQGYTPLHAAIFKGHENIIRLLLPHSNVNAQDKFGRTPLHSACRKGYCDIVRDILQRGGDPNMKTKRGSTVYHILRLRKRYVPIPDFNELFAALNITIDDTFLNILADQFSQLKVDYGACFEIISAHIPFLVDNLGR